MLILMPEKQAALIELQKNFMEEKERITIVTMTMTGNHIVIPKEVVETSPLDKKK